MKPLISIVVRLFSGKITALISSAVLYVVLYLLLRLAALSPEIAASIDPNKLANGIYLILVVALNAATNKFHLDNAQGLLDRLKGAEGTLQVPVRRGVPVALLIGAMIFSLAFTGCTPDQVELACPTITMTVEGGTALAISLAKVPAYVVKNLNMISLACYSVTGGNSVPTVAMLDRALGTYVNDPVAAKIGQMVSGLYAQYFPKLGGNVKVADDLINALALGVSNATGGTASLAALAAAARYRPMILARLRAANLSRY
jgi:hypothetical protein